MRGLLAESAVEPIYWVPFGALVALLLFLDLAVFHRKAHAVHPREAIGWTAFWVALAVGFNIWIWLRFGPEKGKQFLAGYLIEEALSVDNVFVFVVIFRYFAVRPEFHHRILFWGILGAIGMRLGFVLAGSAFLEWFHPAVYGFGAFLIYTGWKLLVHRDAETDPGRSPALRLFRRFVPTTLEYEGARFIVKRGGRRRATPLLLVLVVVETTDLLFAVDSVPAILAITTDPFIVLTSNIFAILGLRSVYFLLAGMMGSLRFLKTGLSFILIFVGGKMLLGGMGVEMDITLALGVVAAVLAALIAASLLLPKTGEVPAGPPPAPVEPPSREEEPGGDRRDPTVDA